MEVSGLPRESRGRERRRENRAKRTRAYEIMETKEREKVHVIVSILNEEYIDIVFLRFFFTIFVRNSSTFNL